MSVAEGIELYFKKKYVEKAVARLEKGTLAKHDKKHTKGHVKKTEKTVAPVVASAPEAIVGMTA